ncbi:hypothetical protein [Flavitalea antarctica]
MESVHLICDSLKLARLDKGFDSIHVRFWFRYVGKYDQQLVSISYTKHEWKAIYCEFTPVHDDERKLVTFRKKIAEVLPRHSFERIIHSIDDLGIWNIKDRSNMVDYPDVHNTDQVSIEVSSKYMYRIIQHSDLEEVSQTVPDVAKIRKMLQLLISEFDIKLIRDI